MQSDDSHQSARGRGSEDTGHWLVVTQGTRHVWDLDRMEHTRLPGPESKFRSFLFDGQSMRVTCVERWPKAGGRSWNWYDDPELPRASEHFRISSEVHSITRLVEDEPPAETQKSAPDET